MKRLAAALLLTACQEGALGLPGQEGSSCGVEQQGDDAVITCSDGTSTRITAAAGPDGEDGVPGHRGDPPPGSPALLRVDPGTLGCEGGAKVSAGRDLDGDGVLGAGEIEVGAELCPPAPTCRRIEGSLVFDNSYDLSALEEAACPEVQGSLRVDVPGLPDLGALRHLSRVGGTLVVVGSAAVDLDPLLALRDVGSLVLLGNAQLASVAGLSGLTAAREIDIEESPLLSSLAGLEGLQATEDLTVSGTAVRDLAPLAGLAVAPSSLTLTDNRELERVNLPATTGEVNVIQIRDNDRLRSLGGLRPSRVVVRLDVQDNPVLPTCEVNLLLAEVTGLPQQIFVRDNDDEGVCE